MDNNARQNNDNRSKDERRAARKKKQKEVYATLGIGLLTWVIIITLVVFGASALMDIARGEDVSVLGEPDDSPIVSLENVVAPSTGVDATGTTDADDTEDLSDSTELDDVQVVDLAVDYLSLAPNDFLYVGSVATLLMIDFPEFTNINSVPQEYIIAYGIMQNIKDPIYTQNVSVSDLRVYVSSSGVENAIFNELGYTNIVEHDSVISAGGEFKYDIISNRYSALSHGLEEGVIGQIFDITKEDGIVTMDIDIHNTSEVSGGLDDLTEAPSTTTDEIPTEPDALDDGIVDGDSTSTDAELDNSETGTSGYDENGNIINPFDEADDEAVAGDESTTAEPAPTPDESTTDVPALPVIPAVPAEPEVEVRNLGDKVRIVVDCNGDVPRILSLENIG